MRTHTALHVLCGVIWADHRVAVTGGNMTAGEGRLDFPLESMSGELGAWAQRRVNEEIARAREVVVAFVPRGDADRDPALIRTRADLIPATVDPLRVIDIVGLDKQADGGTHVASTAEVGGVTVLRTESKGVRTNASASACTTPRHQRTDGPTAVTCGRGREILLPPPPGALPASGGLMLVFAQVDTNPLRNALERAASFLPTFLAFLAILIIGYFVAKIIAGVVDKVLERVGFDRAVERGGVKKALAKSQYDASSILSKIVFYALFLFVLQMAFGVFGDNPISELIFAVIAFLPSSSWRSSSSWSRPRSPRRSAS